jgi:hypothetical protein
MVEIRIRTTAGDDTTLAQGALSELSGQLSGTLIRRGDEGYDEARSIWNGMLDKRPALIARCLNVDDVVATVTFARRHDLLVSVRGGGHNVAGTSLCDDGLVIDLSLMNGVEVDPGCAIARAQGGATLGDVDAATQPHGLAAPLGVVSETGIAGLTLSGGIGWLRRKHGLSCDNLRSAEVATADGRVLTASETENPDLFWGLKGGGGNFGIVTTFEMQLHPLGPEVMFTFVLYHGSQAEEALRYYHAYCASAPDEVSALAMCGTVPPGEAFPAELHGEPFVNFTAMYAGSVEEGERVLKPLLEFEATAGSHSGPMVAVSGALPYTEVQAFFDEEYPAGYHYYWKSLFLDRFDDEVIDAFVTCAAKRPSMLSTVDLWQMGGAVRRFGAEDSAVGNRDAPYLLGVEANWEPPADDEAGVDAANVAWTRECIARMQRFSSGGQYLNFPGFYEEGDATIRTTFGSRYDRLVALKTKYDPTNFFRLNGNIKPMP